MGYLWSNFAFLFLLGVSNVGNIHSWRFDSTHLIGFLGRNNNNSSFKIKKRSYKATLLWSIRGGYGGTRSGENITDKLKSYTVTPTIDEPSPAASKKIALILMDAFSPYHSMFLAHRAKVLYGVTIVPILSDYMKGFFQLEQPPNLKELMSMCIPSKEEKGGWLEKLEGYELVAVVCESDSGLPDAERLETFLDTSFQNGFNEARRNKFMMIERLRENGISVMKQQLCSTLGDARTFALELGLQEQSSSTRVVVKPVRGVGSEDVCLCQNITEVEDAFERIHGSTVFGSPREKHQSVLVQEFAEGQEYAFDVVSKNGEHKVAAVWKYDKRPANGASFVYFATKLYDGSDVVEMADYLRKSLDALQISWGITHSEIIMTANGPQLVEVNCRQHNMDFLPMTMECIGYNVFDMLLTAYLGDKDPDIFPLEPAAERLNWELLPVNPSMRMNGAMVHLVCFANGTLSRINEDALREIQNMESVVDLEVYPPFLDIGNDIHPTTDIKTDAGWVQMVHPDSEQFQKDYDRIIELMPSIFETENAR